MTTSAPTLYPSEQEFSEPILYLSSPEVIAIGEKYGIFKIVPPKNWKPPFSLDKENFRFITRLQRLNELNLSNRYKSEWLVGFNNYMSMLNSLPIEKGLVTLKDGSFKHIYEIFVEGVDNFKFADSQDKKNLKKYIKFLETKEVVDDDPANRTSCQVCRSNKNRSTLLLCDGKDCKRQFHLKCLDPPLKRVPKGDWFCDQCLTGGSGAYGFEEDYKSIFSVDDFQAFSKRYEQAVFHSMGLDGKPSLEALEETFWRLVNNPTASLEVRYGADIHNPYPGQISGFPMEQSDRYSEHPFNLTKLPFAKGSLLNYISEDEISGMTIPWIYIGSLFSTFCWHKEDHYTLSANYSHFGAPKKWYGIPAHSAELFDQVFHKITPDYFEKQPDLLHQLVTLLSPKEVSDFARDRMKQDLPIYSVTQNAGEYVITFPKAYHAGFNAGFNFNEAVNFTMPHWLKYSKAAIADYKRVGKENVFNYIKLIRNVLQEFLTMERKGVNTSFNDYIDMIRFCADDYEREYNAHAKFTPNGSLYHQMVKLRYLPPTAPTKKLKEELLCKECRSCVNFKWVELLPSAFLLGRLLSKREYRNAQLHTPELTPVRSSTPDREAEFARIIAEAKKLSDITQANDKRPLESEPLDAKRKRPRRMGSQKVEEPPKKVAEGVREIYCLEHLQDATQNHTQEDVLARGLVYFDYHEQQETVFLHSVREKLTEYE